MENINYTETTSYDFYNDISGCDTPIKVVGVYDQNRIGKILKCGGNTENWVQFNIPEIVDIPSQKPDMEGLVGVYSNIEIICARVIYTPEVTGYVKASTNTFVEGVDIHNAESTHLTGKKLVIRGVIKQKVVYTAAAAIQDLHSASFSASFSKYILVPKETPINKKFRIYPYIEDVYGCMLSERSVFKNTTIFIKAIPCI